MQNLYVKRKLHPLTDQLLRTASWSVHSRLCFTAGAQPKSETLLLFPKGLNSHQVYIVIHVQLESQSHNKDILFGKKKVKFRTLHVRLVHNFHFAAFPCHQSVSPPKSNLFWIYLSETKCASAHRKQSPWRQGALLCLACLQVNGISPWHEQKQHNQV